MKGKLVANRRSDQVGPVRIKAFLDQQIDLPEIDGTEVDRDFFRVAAFGANRVECCGLFHFFHPSTIHMDGYRLVFVAPQHQHSGPIHFPRNHGLLVASASIPQAFNAIYWLENACRAQVDAMACNTELHLPPQHVIDKTAHLYKPETRRPYGEMEWPAMLRFLDRRDPSYRN
jgi:hypothetical protein